MKQISTKKINFILLMCTVFLPGSVLASSVYISADHSEFFVGDTVVLDVRIDTENKDINVVEGEVLLDYAVDTVSLTNINTSDSTFSLWPRKPVPSERNSQITFAGGTPDGLVSKDATIFSIVFKLEKTGQISISPNNTKVYLNDGQGTEDVVRNKNLIIDILPKKSDTQPADDWNNLISNDKTAPEPFEIYLGQDDSVFDGKKFLSFNTTDTQSGIAYYEVIEGNLPPVRSNNTYILQQQDSPVITKITAYDSAGNARESIYNPGQSSDQIKDEDTSTKGINIPYVNIVMTILLILAVFSILWFVVIKKIKKKNDSTKK